jgi:SAM-dependent methyltransferase
LPKTLRPFGNVSVLICERPSGGPPFEQVTSHGELIMGNVREAVRKQYGRIGALGDASGGCCPPGNGSGDAAPTIACAANATKLGYSEEEVASAPEGANLGLGCGNPQAIAQLKAGETVLDLGSGGGFDCFLAARQVGPTGTVIGVDMTGEMIERARENAKKAATENVEFRLGEIEHLPVADATVDVILSNCVVNLSPDKPAVFRDAFRVLKPGGRLAISDIVATSPLPAEVRSNLELHVGCMAGAEMIDELRTMLTDAGFTEIRITPQKESRVLLREWLPDSHLEDYVVSATIEAVRP